MAEPADVLIKVLYIIYTRDLTNSAIVQETESRRRAGARGTRGRVRSSGVGRAHRARPVRETVAAVAA
jgi:hypothetical protein